MDLLIRVKEYIETNLNMKVVSPLLNDDPESIAIRQTPSSSLERYIEGKNYEISFQILIKNKSNISSYNTANAIFMLLDDVDPTNIVSNDGSFSLIKCECTTLPNFVERYDTGEVVYTAIFSAEIIL